MGYFPSVKTAFSTVRKHFGPKNKFILYDLGGVNETYVSYNLRKLSNVFSLKGSEISKMCNIELRTFDFNQLPDNVKELKIFSWKVFIIAVTYSN